MPTTYDKAHHEVSALVREIMQKFHKDHVEAELRVTCLFAHNSEGPALKLHGYPCAATVKINSYRDRVEGKGDATIVIDARLWETMPDTKRKALIDHELYHLKVKRKNGAIATDDIGRPKLAMRLHDIVVGGFSVIAKRYGKECFEHDHIQSAIDKSGQYFLFETQNKERAA